MEANGKWRNVKPVELALFYRSQNPEELFWNDVIELMAKIHFEPEEEEMKKRVVVGKINYPSLNIKNKNIFRFRKQ